MSTPTVTRRDAIKGTALAALATALSAAPTLAAGNSDQAMIDAEVEITRLYTWLDANSDAHQEREDCDDFRQTFYDEVYEHEAFIAQTAPVTLIGAAVKLRRLLDLEVGIDSSGDHDTRCLAQVLALVHSIVGIPTHPTRPTLTGDEETRDYSGDAGEGGAA
jgi:hypothetical protein